MLGNTTQWTLNVRKTQQLGVSVLKNHKNIKRQQNQTKET